MNFGLVLAEFNDIAYLSKCLEPWIEYRSSLIRNNTQDKLFISIVDVSFLENNKEGEPINSTDGSIELLVEYLNLGKIDYFGCLGSGKTEAQARNDALAMISSNNLQAVCSIGSDEVFTINQIDHIFQYIKKDQLVCWYFINYKNFTFDHNHWTLDFAPPRIFKTSYNGFKLKGWYFDDDLEYISSDNQSISYKSFPNKKIPNLTVDHFSWCDFDRCVKKVNYQNKHFGHYAGCAFMVDEVNKKIAFNPEYFRKTNTSPPIIYSEE